ncbi:MAG TPA: universal stress protein [Bacteroidetes bacterium]|nr:universal stress protein [Bacteroidota bacterium]
MKKVNKILFPTDFSATSQNAFRFALWFADKLEADIDLLHVVYPEAEPMDFPVLVARATKQKMEAAKDMVKIFMDTGMAQVQAAHPLQNVPNVHADIEMGISSVLIPEVAKTDNVDMIIMGTQGEHSTLERIVGSVTSAVIRKAHCPVLVVPEKAQFEHLTTVAYATDLSETDPFHIWETGKILSPFSPILRVVHIEKEANEKKPINMKDLETFFANRAPALQINFHNIRAGNVMEELENFVNIWEVDLMVMHRPKRGFFEKLFHTSFTKKEVFHTHVPLLIIK